MTTRDLNLSGPFPTPQSTALYLTDLSWFSPPNFFLKTQKRIFFDVP